MTAAARRRIICLSSLIFLHSPVARSLGKNGGGALYFHFTDAIEFNAQDLAPEPYFAQFDEGCAPIDPSECGSAYLTDCHYGRILEPNLGVPEPEAAYVLWVCAVFPESTCVELARVHFEIASNIGVALFDYGFLHPEAGVARASTSGTFPSADQSGITISFDPPLTSHVAPICYLIGTPEPAGGFTSLAPEMWFQDNDYRTNPPVSDPSCPCAVAHWLRSGYAGCNPSLGAHPNMHACCLMNEDCVIMNASDCERADGVWRIGVDDCDPSPCEGPRRACCFENGGCSLMGSEACALAGGAWLSHLTACSGGDIGNPCRLRVCCLDLEPHPVLNRKDECELMGGEWLPEIGHFEPNPCDAGAPARSATWGRVKGIYRSK